MKLVRTTNESDRRAFGWMAAFTILVAFSIPWFLWGNATVAYGLPVWLWWHVGWMVVAALVFRVFARRAWGLGVTGDAVAGDDVEGDA